jgi:hypothetical protein
MGDFFRSTYFWAVHFADPLSVRYPASLSPGA